MSGAREMAADSLAVSPALARPRLRADIPPLTALRGVAALWVVGYHIGQGIGPKPLAGLGSGFMAVDIFFVLSGFILTLVHQDLAARGVGGFFVKRLLRVYPLDIAVMLLMLLGAWAHGTLGTGWYAWSKFPPVLLMVEPFMPGPPIMGWLITNWSVGIELLCYLLFPVLLIGLRRLPSLALMGVVAAAAAAEWATEATWPGYFFGLGAVLRGLCGFGLGGAIACLVWRCPPPRSTLAACGEVVCLLGLLAAIWLSELPAIPLWSAGFDRLPRLASRAGGGGPGGRPAGLAGRDLVLDLSRAWAASGGMELAGSRPAARRAAWAARRDTLARPVPGGYAHALDLDLSRRGTAGAPARVTARAEVGMKIGFIGLGIMGRPMAEHLRDAGHEVLIPDRPSLASELRSAMTVLGDPAAIAEQAETIILMLPDTPDVEHALFGPQGVIEGLSPGKLVVDMSSISPTATAEFARRIASQECEWLDAPVSGGEVGAKAATLTIMAGGSTAAFERARPLLERMGKNITHVGEQPGAGQTCKVANQIIVALTIEAVAEALTFARRAGADPARVRAALMGGFASSRILEVHGERMIAGKFEPGFRIRLHQKDLNLALSSARELEMALPSTALAQQLFSTVAAQGGADLDHSALVKAIELMAGENRE